MPITPFHYPIAYLISKLNNKLILPGLIVGSMMPDFEILIILLFFQYRFLGDRLVLHSLLGAASFGTILALLFTNLLYPKLVTTFFRVQRGDAMAKCRLSVNLVLSCLLGSISHVLLDILTHQSNPIFWPFQATTTAPIYPYPMFLPTHTVLAVLILTLLIVNRRNPWKKLLVESS